MTLLLAALAALVIWTAPPAANENLDHAAALSEADAPACVSDIECETLYPELNDGSL